MSKTHSKWSPKPPLDLQWFTKMSCDSWLGCFPVLGLCSSHNLMWQTYPEIPIWNSLKFMWFHWISQNTSTDFPSFPMISNDLRWFPVTTNWDVSECPWYVFKPQLNVTSISLDSNMKFIWIHVMSLDSQQRFKCFAKLPNDLKWFIMISCDN